eukprot:COSAG04_NODE_6991_length_1214_cov_1.365022_1_plen_404_part_11
MISGSSTCYYRSSSSGVSCSASSSSYRRLCWCSHEEDVVAPVPVGASLCEACRAGTSDHDTNSSTGCEACALGRHQSETAATTCESCPAGTFTPSAGAAFCTDCPAGTYSSQVALSASACIDCASGLFSTAVAATNASTCVVCGPGHYTAQAATQSGTTILMGGNVHSLEVRLSEGNQLQMNADSRGWAAVCDDGFGDAEAAAACRSLGFGPGTAVVSPCGEDDDRCPYDWFAVDGLDCPGDAASLRSCSVSNRPYQHDCDADEAVLLDCGGANSTRLAGGAEASADILPAAVNASEPTFALEMGDQIRNAQMRLIGGSESAGVLAMNVDGRGWAPVCDDGFDENAVAAVCSALGHDATGAAGFRPWRGVGGTFRVVSGQCTTSSEGLCFRSPNYPNDYPDYDY